MESGNAQQFFKSAQSFATDLEGKRNQLADLGKQFNVGRMTEIFNKNMELDQEARAKAEAVSAFAISAGMLPEGVKGLYGASKSLYGKLKDLKSAASDGLEVAEGESASMTDILGNVGDQLLSAASSEISSGVDAGIRSAGASLLSQLRSVGGSGATTGTELANLNAVTDSGVIGTTSVGPQAGVSRIPDPEFGDEPLDDFTPSSTDVVAAPVAEQTESAADAGTSETADVAGSIEASSS